MALGACVLGRRGVEHLLVLYSDVLWEGVKGM